MVRPSVSTSTAIETSSPLTEAPSPMTADDGAVRAVSAESATVLTHPVSVGSHNQGEGRLHTDASSGWATPPRRNECYESSSLLSDDSAESYGRVGESERQEWGTRVETRE